MPVLEPNPPDSRKKLLLVFAAIIGIIVLISIVATIAESMG
ncbi:SGM_5486 family transporter-associated protein [Kitasatospora sp. NBC_01266]|nr:SGM_5486 family transporter-associated protein [Kitasatospora sp. NBC_01266]